MQTAPRRCQATDLFGCSAKPAGCASRPAVADTAAPVVIYVSCEPSTLARDLASFRALGYQPDHLEGFDLFPGTAHVETVVRLRRG